MRPTAGRLVSEHRVIFQPYRDKPHQEDGKGHGAAMPQDTDLEAKLARTERELSEALEQQTATSEVLRVISSSPGELEPVFQVMLENATRICEANFGVLFRFKGDAVEAAAMLGVPPAFAEFWQRGPQRPGGQTALARVRETRQMIHVVDVMADPADIAGRGWHGSFLPFPDSCTAANGISIR
jgi:hypothetical protein